MTWEALKEPPRKRAYWGRLRAHMRCPRLYITTGLQDAGFDVDRRYFLLYDRGNRLVGLREADRDDGNAYRVYRDGITMTHFCRKFGLTEDYEIVKAEKIDDTWVLHLSV